MSADLETLPKSLDLQQKADIVLLDRDGLPLVSPKSTSYNTGLLRHRFGWLFLLTVVFPLFLGSIYYFIIASNQYMSETQFIVRSTNSSAASGIAALIQNQGLARASDETQDVLTYVKSYDMVMSLVKKDNLLSIYGRPQGDFINRYPNFFGKNTEQKLFHHYLDWMKIWVDESTGIVTLDTFAFVPSDAVSLSQAIVHQSESLINKLNDRAQADAVAYSQKLVDQAKDEFVKVEDQLTAFRNSNGTADPGHEAVMSFNSTHKLTTELAKLRAELSQTSTLTPMSPELPSLRANVRSYQQVIDAQKSRLAGSQTSLATKLSAYEQLNVKKLLAMHELENAVLNLERAKSEAKQQHFYIQTIVEPNLPDFANYPRASLGLLLIGILGLCSFLILSNFYSISKEHRR
ncbi:MAG: hypothetical protein KGQ46_04190 [Hyphomicrobiales bacterium]|nr:hypothetical protein [Hyphomicrobiales bacterium]MDE2115948.1 hypothetical protein [Hyphomicrobiales bacterium]